MSKDVAKKHYQPFEKNKEPVRFDFFVNPERCPDRLTMQFPKERINFRFSPVEHEASANNANSHKSGGHGDDCCEQKLRSLVREGGCTKVHF